MTLRRFVEFAVGDGLSVAVHVEEGAAAARVLALAAGEGADLLVVGTHARTGLDRLLLGSVAEEIIEGADRPVVTVRPLPDVIAAVGGRLERIVYATDLSPGAARAWPWVRGLAGATGAPVDVLHVAAEGGAGEAPAPPDPAGARAAVEEVLARLGLEGPLAGRLEIHVLDGSAAEQIVGWARGRGAGLLALGTRGRSGDRERALGSVVRRVLHRAPCPVLTVGPPGADRSAGAGPGR